MWFAPQLVLTSLLTASYASANTLVARQSDATGDAVCVEYMCINATVTGSQVEYVLSSTGVRTVGWMGIGWGRQMSGSSIVVVWPNSDGTFTLSQRTATGHVLPTVDSNPTRVATIQESSSDVTASQPRFAFTMPVGTIGTENIIWAFGATNPSSSSPSAPFVQHLDHGQTSLDLAGSLGNGTSPTPDDETGGAAPPLDRTGRMIIAHGILLTIGFLFILPLGGLVARYFRTSTSTWFRLHQVIQSVVAGPIIIVGFALGATIVADSGDSHFAGPHTKIGLTLFILYIVQVLFGTVIHTWKPKSAALRRPAQNYVHVFLGIAIISIAFYQVHLGYKDLWAITGQDPLPRAADIVFYIWLAVIPILYFGGMALLPKQFRQESASRAPKEVNHETGENYRNS